MSSGNVICSKCGKQVEQIRLGNTPGKLDGVLAWIHTWSRTSICVGAIAAYPETKLNGGCEHGFFDGCPYGCYARGYHQSKQVQVARVSTKVVEKSEARKLRREALELVRKLENALAPKELIQKARARFKRRELLFYRSKYPSYRVIV